MTPESERRKLSGRSTLENLRLVLQNPERQLLMSDNVLPFDSARKSKSSKEKQKINPIVLFETMANHMRREDGAGTVWPHCFRVYEPESGKRIPVMVRQGEASIVSLDAVTATVMAHARHQAMQSAGGEGSPASWLFDDDKCIKAARYWLRSVPTIRLIPMLGWLDDETPIAWRQLPWRRDTAGATPTWDRLLAGASNAEAFKLWLASCFVETADLTTYIWMHGQGANGKSRILAFLAAVFGSAYVGTDESAVGGKHWTAALVGKRIAAFPDTNTRKVTTSGKFKSITGGDAVAIEPKFQAIFPLRLPIRFILSSNNAPELSSGSADMRRCIYVEMQPIPEAERLPTAQVDAALWAEGAAFVSHCLELYRARCADDRAVPFDTEGSATLAAEAEVDFGALVDMYLKTGSPTFRLAGHELVNLMRNAWGKRTDSKTMAEFVDYLIRHFGTKKIKSNGRIFYLGLGLTVAGQAMASGHPKSDGISFFVPPPPLPT